MVETRTSWGYMPLYIADYDADTSHLSTLEHGAYFLLIKTYWKSGGALPDSDLRLANIAHMSMDDWRVVKPILAEFFRAADGKWFHKRIEKELEHFRDKSTKAKAARQAGIDKKRREHEAREERLKETALAPTFNGRSTDVNPPTPTEPLNHPNGRSTDVQRTPMSNGRSTSVNEIYPGEKNKSFVSSGNTNGRSTDVGRTINHEDEDEDEYINPLHSGSTEALDKHTHRNGGARVLASDLDGPTSSRFPEFWEKYPYQIEKDAACREFVSVVSAKNEHLVFACLDRYLASDQVSRGVVSKPAIWLQKQNRDKWESKWPGIRTNGHAPSPPKPYGCQTCKVVPCVCFQRHLEREEANGD